MVGGCCGGTGERDGREIWWAIRIVKRISQACFDEMSGQREDERRDEEQKGQNKDYRKHGQRRESRGKKEGEWVVRAVLLLLLLQLVDIVRAGADI